MRNYIDVGVNELARNIHNWSTDTFGPPTPDRVLGKKNHLKKEIAELDVIVDGVLGVIIDGRFAHSIGGAPFRAIPELARAEMRHASETAEELADCLILLLDLVISLGLVPTAIIEKKMAINRQREWKAPNADGSVEHV